MAQFPISEGFQVFTWLEMYTLTSWRFSSYKDETPLGSLKHELNVVSSTSLGFLNYIQVIFEPLNNFGWPAWTS